MMKRDMLVLCVCTGLLAVSLAVGSILERPGEADVSALAAGSGARQLILDAGHGGEDGGAVSASGVKESDVNLAVVLKLDQLMGFCGVPAVLTRDGDYAIYDSSASTLREKKVSDLHNRVALIEGAGDPVVISVHQNTFPDGRYKGAQVFFGKAEGSRPWGERTQEALRAALDAGNSRKAKPIPETVYLMEHISCPAILVECGFLSNSGEAALLTDPGYQRKLAAILAVSALDCLNTDTWDV